MKKVKDNKGNTVAKTKQQAKEAPKKRNDVDRFGFKKGSNRSVFIRSLTGRRWPRPRRSLMRKQAVRCLSGAHSS